MYVGVDKSMKMQVVPIPLLHYSYNYIPTPKIHIILFFQGQIAAIPDLEQYKQIP